MTRKLPLVQVQSLFACLRLVTGCLSSPSSPTVARELRKNKEIKFPIKRVITHQEKKSLLGNQQTTKTTTTKKTHDKGEKTIKPEALITFLDCKWCKLKGKSPELLGTCTFIPEMRLRVGCDFTKSSNHCGLQFVLIFVLRIFQKWLELHVNFL